MKMPRKQTAAQRRAKQAAKRHSAASNKAGKHLPGAKAPVDSAGGVRGLKAPSSAPAANRGRWGPRPPSESQLAKIEKPIYGGAFLARVEGKAVFVPLTLPGEQARVRIIQDKRGYATAEAEEIVTAAPERIASRLPTLWRMWRLQLSARKLRCAIRIQASHPA